MPHRRRPGGSKKGDRNDRADEKAPAKAEPTGAEGRKASLTDRLSGLDSPLGRRGYLGLLGATASLAAVAPVRSATTVNLGDEGLTDGDRIDPYIDGTISNQTVLIPPGEYQWVYFDHGVAEAGARTYYVEVPDGAAATGQYTLGPFQALSPRFGDWMDVPGTASDETVVGVGTSLDSI